MTDHADDHERVRALLGREPRGRYEIVVRDDQGDPVVLRNAPLLDDGTPMPTRYWLIGPAEIRRIGQLESTGGVDAAEAAVDPDELAEAHARYAAERDAAIPADHVGPRPSGGVGGTRVGVKCLHAHWGWHLAGGDDPIGRWIEQQLADAADGPPAGGCDVTIGAESTVVTLAGGTHDIPWGHRNLTARWLADHDPPRPDALTNALGTIDDHLDDLSIDAPGADEVAVVPWPIMVRERVQRRVAGSPRYPWIVLVAALFGLFSVGFTITILSVSVPRWARRRSPSSTGCSRATAGCRPWATGRWWPPAAP